MDIKQTLAITLASILTLSTPIPAHARNCIKGKPCGKGCIALNKTCRIGTDPSGSGSGSGSGSTLRYDPALQPGAVIRRSVLKLPKVYIVTAESVNAKESPYSSNITGRYKQGQRVFVYETEHDWARISNMQPDEWVKLEALRLK
ncbi:MAG: SH3 domain-containing protein [Candidatus Thiodiazotropha endolucinida]